MRAIVAFHLIEGTYGNCVEAEISLRRRFSYEFLSLIIYELSIITQWGKRFFAIEGRYLRWYRSASDELSSGMMNLRFIRKILRSESSDEEDLKRLGTNVFVIFCNDRNIVLRVPTINEMYHWIQALHFHCNIARGGDGSKLIRYFNLIYLLILN